jgi:hypothetical protein
MFTEIFRVLACFGNRQSISNTLLRAYMNLHHFHIYTRYGVKNLSIKVLTIFGLVKSVQRRLYYAYVLNEITFTLYREPL